jgi:hypothetical protein
MDISRSLAKYRHCFWKYLFNEQTRQKRTIMSRNATVKRKAATTAENEMKRAKGETNLFNLNWYNHGEPLTKGFVPLVYLYGETLPGCSKIAAFDMDSTLISVKSGAKFAKGKHDKKYSLLSTMANERSTIVF